MIDQILDVKDADLSKDLAMINQCNKLTVAYSDPEFLDWYNILISDRSTPSGEYYNDINKK